MFDTLFLLCARNVAALDRPSTVSRRRGLVIAALVVILFGTVGDTACAQLPADYQTIVDQTWANSTARRQAVLTSVVNSGSVWPYGIQGQTMWDLSALSLNRSVETANAHLLASSTAANPYAFFDVYSYLKIATMFGQNSSFADTRGRITAQTEAAMKQVLWTDVSGTSLAMAALDRVWWVNESENLDLNKNVTSYLAASILKDDANFSNRLYADGKKAVDHYNGWNAWYQSWLKERATHGLLAEIGSDTYQKYSVAAITTLRDLSPDPVVQQRAEMMLDLFYIDEAQYSIGNRRGGGKSRNNGAGGSSEFEGITKLMYGEGGAASHTKVFETSTYQVPAVAALIRGAETLDGPIEIRTRIPGQSQAPSPAGLPSGFYALSSSSRLVNYEYRTPYYELGSTLQDDNLAYAAISSQLRWGGMLFGDLKAVYPEAEQSGGSYPQNAYWSYQNKSSMVLQKMPNAQYTGDLSIFISGSLTKREQDGWIFATNNKAFLGVRVVSGSYTWTDTQRVTPTNQTSPVILQAGDITDYASLDDFITKTLSLSVTVASDRVTYGAPEGQIEFFTSGTSLPRLNGKSLDLNTPYTYSGPYLHSSFGSDTITASFGRVQTVYDFTANTVTTSTVAPAALAFSIASGTTRTQLQEGYPVLWQDGAVTKSGAGTLVLDGANTFSGTTTVESGTLLAANSAFARPGRSYVVAQGATLGLTDKWVRFGTTGTTTVSGSGTLRVPQGTTFSSPNAAGHGDLVLALGSGARIEVSGTLGAGFASGRGSVLWGMNRGDLSVESTGQFDVQAAASVTVDALLGSGVITKSSTGATSLTIGIDNGSGTFSGSIANPTGTLSLVKSGTGTQVLSGMVSLTGGVSVASGRLTLSSSNSYAGTTTVAAGGALVVAVNGGLGAAATSTTLTGGAGSQSGVLGFAGVNYTAGEKIEGAGLGNMAAVDGLAAVQRGFVQGVSGSSAFAGTIEINGSGVSRIGTQDGAVLNLTGAIVPGAGVSNVTILFRAGDLNGDFVVLSGTNNSWDTDAAIYTGNATVGQHAGVRLGANDALPTNRSIVGAFTSNNQTLDLAGFSQTLSGLTGTAPAGLAVRNLKITNLAASSTSTLTLDMSTAMSTGNTTLQEAAGVGRLALVKQGAGSQTLSGSSSYTGGTTITSGTLVAGHAHAIGGTANALAVNGGALNTGMFSLAVGALSGSSGGVVTTATTAGTRTLSTNVASGTSEFAGSIQDNGAGLMALTKGGAGKLTLAGFHSYTGATTVNAGMLAVNGSLGATAVTVGSAGTLGGSGSIAGDVTVNGMLSPGNSPGELTVANLVLGVSSTSLFEINGLARGTDYDGITLTGTSLVYGGALSMSFGTTFGSGTSLFDLFAFSGAPMSAFSSVLSTGAYAGTWTLDGSDWLLESGDTLLTFGSSTGDLTVTVVPEPATILTLGIGLAIAVVRASMRANARAVSRRSR